jgi:hypothetical protein
MSSFRPIFDLAFVVHYIDGSTIHGIWNSNSGVFEGKRLSFTELTKLRPVSSIEIVYRDKRSGHINRSVLSVPTTDKKIQFVLIFRGMYKIGGFSQVSEENIAAYENKGIQNPKYLVIPGAVQLSLVALEVNDNVDRQPNEALKTYPILVKLTIDSFGVFMRDQ